MQPLLLLLLSLLSSTEARALHEEESLFQAAEQGDLERVRRYLAEGDYPSVDVRDPQSRTPLILAARSGDPETVRELVTAGADVNSQDIYGWGPLHWAADTNHVRAVHALLEHGANIDLTDTEGWTALHWAAYRGDSLVVQELMAGGANIFLETKMDRNTRKRYTAWDLAMAFGHRDVASLLEGRMMAQ